MLEGQNLPQLLQATPTIIYIVKVLFNDFATATYISKRMIRDTINQ